MKAKIKSGHHILYSEGYSNDWNNLTDCMIINFMNKYSYLSFKQFRNHLLIETTEGDIDIVFTGIHPDLSFESFCKGQLVLTINKPTL